MTKRDLLAHRYRKYVLRHRKVRFVIKMLRKKQCLAEMEK